MIYTITLSGPYGTTTLLRHGLASTLQTLKAVTRSTSMPGAPNFHSEILGRARQAGVDISLSGRKPGASAEVDLDLARTCEMIVDPASIGDPAVNAG